MFRHFSNYSSSPVSPVSPSPSVWGRAAVHFVGGTSAHESVRTQEKSGGSVFGPSVENNVRLQGLSREELAAAARNFDERLALLGNERSYAELGKNALRAGLMSGQGEEASRPSAPVQSSGLGALAHGEGLFQRPEKAQAPLDGESVDPDLGEAERQGDAASVSGGRELRSAERSYAGAAASGQERGNRESGTDDGRRGAGAFSLSGTGGQGDESGGRAESGSLRAEAGTRKAVGVYAGIYGALPPALPGRVLSMAV